MEEANSVIWDQNSIQNHQALSSRVESEIDDHFIDYSTDLVFTPERKHEPLETIKLKGDWTEIFTIKSIKTNTLVLTLMLSTTSFGQFNINFLMKNVNGSIIENTIASQTSELLGDIFSGYLYLRHGSKNGFSIAYSLSFFGSLLLIQAIRHDQT